MSEYLSRHQSPAHEAELFLQSFEECFTERSRNLGRELFEDEAVEDVALTHGELTARVKGGKVYPVVLDLTRELPEDALRHCTCPAFRSFGPCKHQYALLLEAAEQHSTGKLDLFDLECGGSAARREQAEREGRRWLPEWRKRLDRLGESRAVLRHDPWASATQDRRQLRYVLLRDASVERGEMVCELSYRAKRAAGDWSNWRIASEEDRDLVHRVSRIDAELFSLLRAAMNDWFDPMEDMQAAFDSRFYCSGPLTPEIARRLCATGRFVADAKDTEGIAWLPEKFTLQIQVNREEGQSRCEAQVVSESQSFPFSEIRILLRDGLFLCDAGFGQVDLRNAFPLAAEIWREGAIEVPEEQEEQLLEQVFQWPVETRLPDSVEALVPVEAQPCLYLDRPPEEVRNSSRAARTKLEARVLFDYSGVIIDPADGGPTVQVAEAEGEKPAKRARRDHEREAAFLRRFLELDVRRSPMLDGRVIGAPHATIEDRQRSQIASELLVEGWRVETDGKAWRRSGDVSFQLSTGVDWFDLSGGVDFGTERIELPRLLKALEKGERSFELEDGTIGLLDERTLRDWALLETGTATKEGTLRFGRSQGWLLDALLAERDDVRVDAGFEEFRSRLAAFEGMNPRTEPESFQGTLRA
ncbi:MAG: SWIM zinc finger family protein, partial [Planctomycetota bacterium]